MNERLNLPAGFESVQEVQQRRARLVDQLARAGGRRTTALAHTIGGCTDDAPCESGACPACQRTWRIAMLRQADDVLGEGPLLRISWVPAGGIAPLGRLARFDLSGFIASRRRALQRALPGVVAYGGVDVSLNTADNAARVWQVHLYVIAEAEDTPGLRRAVRDRCRGEPSAPRPLHFLRVSNRFRAFTYAMKSVVYRRSGYLDRLGRRNTRPQRLKAADAVEVALYQARWPSATRLLLCGLRQYHGLDGPRLVRL